ncbi:hypothetical protein [Endozoicomonas arenosclerae]|uniref:hypothetical protein n=1 Tax=Endozoicomonas arenosclerae TaxID=1633495 RepID=UPI000785E5C8|nr:hypothetical protein [Endozoicomonas arenosclerae]
MRLINRSILFLFLGICTLTLAFGEPSEKAIDHDYFLCHSQHKNPLDSYWYLTTATYQDNGLTGFPGSHKTSSAIARYLKSYFHQSIVCSPIGNSLHRMDLPAEGTHELISVPIVTTDNANITVSAKIVSPELLKIALESGTDGPSPFKQIASTYPPPAVASNGAGGLFNTRYVLMFGVCAFLLANTFGPDWAPILAAGITFTIIGTDKLMRFSSVIEHPYPQRLAKVHVSKQALKGMYAIGTSQSAYELPKVLVDVNRFDKLMHQHVFDNIVGPLSLDEMNRITRKIRDELWSAVKNSGVDVQHVLNPRPRQRVMEMFTTVDDQADSNLLAIFSAQYPTFEKYTTFAMYYHYFKTFVLYTMGTNTWRVFQAMIPQYIFNEAFELVTGKPIESVIGFYEYDRNQGFISRNNLFNDIEDFMVRNWITTLTLSYHFIYLKHRDPALKQFGSVPYSN